MSGPTSRPTSRPRTVRPSSRRLHLCIFAAALAKADRSSSPSLALDTEAAFGSARTTTVQPSGRRVRRLRACHRRRRATACRITDPPTPLPTVNPIRVGNESTRELGAGITWTMKQGRDTLVPRLVVARKSVERVSRCADGSMPDGNPRLRWSCDPWLVDQQESRGLRVCAFATGSRASSPDGGCWAGRCASWSDSWTAGWGRRVTPEPRQEPHDWSNQALRFTGEPQPLVCGTALG